MYRPISSHIVPSHKSLMGQTNKPWYPSKPSDTVDSSAHNPAQLSASHSLDQSSLLSQETMLVSRLEPGLSSRFIRTLQHVASKKPSSKPPSTKASPYDHERFVFAKLTGSLTEQDENARPQAPRLTGSILRPSLFNVPQPRLSPQPVKTSMMIRNRIRARENRREKQLLHMQYIRDMREEFKFWERLGVNDRRSRKSKAVGEVEETGYRELLCSRKLQIVSDS
jgi:hypothetical protein